VSPVRYELGFYTPEDDILHSHRRENLKSYRSRVLWRELYNEELANVYSYPNIDGGD
jgi:hypothetical protein